VPVRFVEQSPPLKVILVHKTAASRSIAVGRWSVAVLSVLCLGLPLGLMALGYELGQRQGSHEAQTERLSAAEQVVSQRAKELAQLSSDARRTLEAMTRKLAELQARVTRLDALGTHITALAGLDGGEFDFSEDPALGGPLTAVPGPVVQPAELASEMELFSATLDDRDAQLDVLAGLLFDAEAQAEAIPSGRPITTGWLSSPYGYRKDPFTGQRAWHQGVDFAGKEGGEVIAVASGVVSWSGEKAGYGTMIEVAHGDGMVTRYGHNEENLVEVGDLVRKGQPIAVLGNTGRSTGPHVHFEVYKHGRPVDPASYIQRTLR